MIVMIVIMMMIVISSGGCELRLIQRGQQPGDQRECGHHSQDLGHPVQVTGESSQPIRGLECGQSEGRSDQDCYQDPIQTMEECKDSVTSLDISDHEILVGSADSR